MAAGLQDSGGEGAKLAGESEAEHDATTVD